EDRCAVRNENAVGSVWDQQVLDALYAGAASYLHGHSVGGTNPSLLRAMGAGAYTIAWDVNFNREVLGGHGDFFDSPRAVAELVEKSEQDPGHAERTGEQARGRAADAYRWEEVATAYEALCRSLV
ncbi:MAG TPA: glycosyltransferase, partial [Pseudonocardia sp.]